MATRLLSGIDYPSLGFTFVVFHQIIQHLNDFLKFFLVSPYHHLALSLRTIVLQRKNNPEKHNGKLSYLSMSVDPRFKHAYVEDVVQKK
jgi:hypothetical protein